jgi:RNA polymerase sigma-70 factor, ECF subfamily
MQGWDTQRHERDAELELIRACVAGEPAAWQSFEQTLCACLQAGVARVRSEPDFVADVVQELRVALFTGPTPRALSFTGRGPLSAWLKVVATRAALDRLRSSRRRCARQREAEALAPNSSTGVEGRIDRDRHGSEISAALRLTLQALRPRDRNLLRLRYVSGLNIDAIAVAYGVHRATVARWLAGLHDEIGRSLRRQLERRTGAQSPSELEGTLRALDSRLASALASFLGAGSDSR